MDSKKNVTQKIKTESRTLRIKENVIEQIEVLAEDNNRNFNNMAETLMRLGMKHYQGIGLNA